jgi:hypothetical protein
MPTVSILMNNASVREPVKGQLDLNGKQTNDDGDFTGTVSFTLPTSGVVESVDAFRAAVTAHGTTLVVDTGFFSGDVEKISVRTGKGPDKIVFQKLAIAA